MRVMQPAIPRMGVVICAATQHINGRESKRSISMQIFRNLFRRRQSRQDAEMAYLNDSVSLYDLECREIEIAKGKFAGF